MSMRVALAIWLMLSFIGGVIVALPDDGQRLISFSDAHGPSPLDAIGIAFLIVGWLVFVAALARRHLLLYSRLFTNRQGLIAPFIIGLGAGLTIASVASDFSGWWIVGALLLFSVQLWLARLVT